MPAQTNDLSKQDIRDVKKFLGSNHRGSVLDTGGGAFGAALLATILSKRLVPSQSRVTSLTKAIGKKTGA